MEQTLLSMSVSMCMFLPGLKDGQARLMRVCVSMGLEAARRVRRSGVGSEAGLWACTEPTWKVVGALTTELVSGGKGAVKACERWDTQSGGRREKRVRAEKQERQTESRVDARKGQLANNKRASAIAAAGLAPIRGAWLGSRFLSVLLFAVAPGMFCPSCYLVVSWKTFKSGTVWTEKNTTACPDALACDCSRTGFRACTVGACGKPSARGESKRNEEKGERTMDEGEGNRYLGNNGQ